jgi:hypothetical protein
MESKCDEEHRRVNRAEEEMKIKQIVERSEETHLGCNR